MIPLQKQKKIIAKLLGEGISTVDDYTPFPKPFYHDLSNVKAIYLGCDPTNTKFNNRFDYAFALPNGNQYRFERFVKGHRAQLEAIGQTWERVYVQNLCQNYFTKETSENYEAWSQAAMIWIAHLKSELAIFDQSLPILLTSELLYKVLLSHGIPKLKASEFYGKPKHIPIPDDQNKLRRPLIPLYRHFAYDLAKWPAYAHRIRAILDK